MGQLYLFALAVAVAYVYGSLLGRRARREDLELQQPSYCDTFCTEGHRPITGRYV